MICNWLASTVERFVHIYGVTRCVSECQGMSVTAVDQFRQLARCRPVGVFGQLVRARRDDRGRTHGLRDRGAFVCVALTLAVDEALSTQYVASEATHRRR